MGTKIIRFFSGTKEEADNGTSYELLYVGIAEKTGTFTRLLTAPMGTRQRILSNEWSRGRISTGSEWTVAANWPPTGCL